MFRIEVGDDLEMRLLEESDAERLFALTEENRAYLRRWLPWLDDTTTVAHTQAFIRSSLEQFAEDNGFQLGIVYRRELAGVIGLHYVNRQNRKTEIGYWLAERFQGRGIMTRCCRALVDYAFKELGLNRVEIRCALENTRSRAIPERLGFTQEGVQKDAEWLYDHFVDLVMYSMLAADWRPASTE
jgi:ribosomal-protein-serine acetyltransferase